MNLSRPKAPILARGCCINISVRPVSFRWSVSPPSNSFPLSNPSSPNFARGCAIKTSLMPFSSMKFFTPPNAPPAKSNAALPKPFSFIDDPAPFAIPKKFGTKPPSFIDGAP